MTEPEHVLLNDLRRLASTVDPVPPAALPCGLRSPDCARPDYCDDCLPRDRKHLHERILTRCNPDWYGLRDDPPKVFAALRAAVELHAPRPCTGMTELCAHLDPHDICGTCGPTEPYVIGDPGSTARCTTVVAAARELGIEVTP